MSFATLLVAAALLFHIARVLWVRGCVEVWQGLGGGGGSGSGRGAICEGVWYDANLGLVGDPGVGSCGLGE